MIAEKVSIQNAGLIGRCVNECNTKDYTIDEKNKLCKTKNTFYFIFQNSNFNG